MHALFDEWLKLAAHLGARCVASGQVIAGAESCTGGLISAVLTSVSGSSAWVDRTLVTYSNSAKQELLGVTADTLERFGAVSEETAREMALGALRDHYASTAANRADAAPNLSYAVTGVAGPTGGSASKPVGMVCFGFARRWGSSADAPARSVEVFTDTRYFAGDRSAVREQSVNHVLAELQRVIDGDWRVNR